MTAYVPPSPAADSMQLRIWTPRRTPTKSTYGGMLDNTVAGGIAAGMGVRETLVKESAEEASLPASLVAGARAVGAVSYFYERDARAGGETGLLQPEVQYVYDLEVDDSVVPRPSDDEVTDFCLMTVDQVRVLACCAGVGTDTAVQVKQELAQGQFKPNCALGVSCSPCLSFLCKADGLQCLLYTHPPSPQHPRPLTRTGLFRAPRHHYARQRARLH